MLSEQQKKLKNENIFDRTHFSYGSFVFMFSSVVLH